MITCSANVIAQNSDTIPVKPSDLTELSLEELMEVKITTATKSPEKLSDAPATVIVLTKEDISQRGYTDLSDIYSDLPGMDVTRPYGDTYMKNYWRGYRNTIDSPYLVMIDGVEFSQLFFNANEIIATFCISNIERVEIVYGPASSVYGPNAMMGVVNIITVNDKEESGTYVKSKLSSSHNGYIFGDFNYFYKKEDFRVSVSGHIEDGDLNQRVNSQDFYYTRNELYADRKLWGGYVDNKNFAGKFSSPIHNHSFDMRLYMHNTEVAFQYNNLYTGFGTTYPGDRLLSRSLWIVPHYNAYVRHTHKFSDKVTSKTLFRFKSDGVKNSSPTIEGFNVTNTDTVPQLMNGTMVDSNETVRVANYSLWQTRNSAFYVFQDFNIEATSKLSIAAGFKFDYKNLQKAYDINYGNTVYIDSIDLTDDGIFPQPPPRVDRFENRIIWIDKGVYTQLKYNITEKLIVNAGGRIDNNTAYGTYETVRAGIVYHLGKFTTKVLFGNAFQEPSPRVLYGGWTGSGSDPDLKPTRSQTFEASLGYTKGSISGLISFYDVRNSNTIITFKGGAENLGIQEVIGSDVHLQTNIPVNRIKQLKLWGYYSIILKQDESKYDASGNKTGTGIIGDLANNKIYFGTTVVVNDKLNATLYGRYIGSKETVVTNPIREIDAYCTLDFNINYKNFLIKGLGLSFKVTNLLDAKYYHTGLREANSGETPGSFDGRTWTGSAGYYNSKLPQPRRFYLMSLTFDLSTITTR